MTLDLSAETSASPHPDGLSALERLRRRITLARQELPFVRISGSVTEIGPSLYRVSGLSRFVNIGDIVTLQSDAGARIGEVVRIDDATVTVKPFQPVVSGGIGMQAFRAGPLLVYPDASWKSRVVNALCQPLDDVGPLVFGEKGMPVDRQPVTALQRSRVGTPVKTSVRVIDTFTPLCKGQRIGIFAGSGVGKSTLLAMFEPRPRLRHGGPGARRRARPRGARIPRRHSRRGPVEGRRRRLDRRRERGDATPRAEDRDDDRRIFSRPRRTRYCSFSIR